MSLPGALVLSIEADGPVRDVFPREQTLGQDCVGLWGVVIDPF